MSQTNKSFHGIVVYKIKGDGCMNSVWTNTDKEGKVMNECVRKIDGDRTSILGDYISVYIEDSGEVIQSTLSITQSDNNYIFKWIKSDKTPFFEGIGLAAGKNHFVASYWIV